MAGHDDQNFLDPIEGLIQIAGRLDEVGEGKAWEVAADLPTHDP